MRPVSDSLCYDVWKTSQVSHLDKVSLMAQQQMHKTLQEFYIIFWERVIRHLEEKYNDTRT